MNKVPHFPFADLPNPQDLPVIKDKVPPPTDDECFALWHKYGMRDNVRRHSLLVAHIAATLAEMANACGINVDAASCRASGLMHDIAKSWCLSHKGPHDVIGASWTMMETRCCSVAQGVLLHVHWPWAIPDGQAICCLPILVLYADKRVRHDQCVTLDERFEDLLVRYGKTKKAILWMRHSFKQAKIIETAIGAQLQQDLHEHSFDCGRMVQRA